MNINDGTQNLGKIVIDDEQEDDDHGCICYFIT